MRSRRPSDDDYVQVNVLAVEVAIAVVELENICRRKHWVTARLVPGGRSDHVPAAPLQLGRISEVSFVFGSSWIFIKLAD